MPSRVKLPTKKKEKSLASAKRSWYTAMDVAKSISSSSSSDQGRARWWYCAMVTEMVSLKAVSGRALRFWIEPRMSV